MELFVWLLVFLITWREGLEEFTAPQNVCSREAAAAVMPPGWTAQCRPESPHGYLGQTFPATTPDGARWTTGRTETYYDTLARTDGRTYPDLLEQVRFSVWHEGQHAWCLFKGGTVGHAGAADTFDGQIPTCSLPVPEAGPMPTLPWST
jgi:hypothetical protein